MEESQDVGKLWEGAEEERQASGRIIRDIQARACEYVIARMKDEMAASDVPSEKISALIQEYERTLLLLRGAGPSITAIARSADLDFDAARLALRLELEQIEAAYDEGRISRGAARRMRENVYLMQVDLGDYV